MSKIKIAASNVVGYKHKNKNNKKRKSNQVMFFLAQTTKQLWTQMQNRIHIKNNIYAFVYR